MQTYTLTALPRYPTFTDVEQQDLNQSNISTWALANLPRTPKTLHRRASTSSSETDKKPKLLPKPKAKSFKLPMNNSSSQPRVNQPGGHEAFPAYERIHLNSPMIPPRKARPPPQANSSPKSRIPHKQGPQPPPRPSYTQVANKLLEAKQNKNFTRNFLDLPAKSDSEGHSQSASLDTGMRVRNSARIVFTITLIKSKDTHFFLTYRKSKRNEIFCHFLVFDLRCLLIQDKTASWGQM